MTSMNQQESQYKPSHAPLASNEAPKYSWADASKVATRYVEVFEAERAEALRSYDCTQQMATDRAQVAAWLDKEARAGTLRVLRSKSDGGRIAQHNVLLLDEEDGEVVSLDIGGYVSMGEINRYHESSRAWLYNKDEIVEGYFRIEVMITDVFPDHEMFKRSDGSNVDLGFNDNQHFYSFMVEIHQDDLFDNY